MTRFEDRLADELGRMAGPEPPVDALAVARSVAEQAPKRRLAPMYTALKFALAAALLALTGGLLAAGAMILFDADERVLDGEALVPTYTFEKVHLGAEDTGAGQILQLPSGALFVNGWASDSSRAWTTTDDGASWTETSPAIALGSVVVFDDQLVALAEGEEIDSGLYFANQFWTSEDGVTWEVGATIEDAHVERLVAAPDGLVAIGWDHRPDGSTEYPRGYPTLWTSSDGATWVANEIATPLPVDEPWPGDCCWAHFMTDPVHAADGTWLVAANYQNDSPGIDRAIIWRSLDGTDWDVVWDPERGSGVDALSSAPDGFEASIWFADELGDEPVTHRMASPDGLEWSDVGAPGDSIWYFGDHTVHDVAGPMVFQSEGLFEVEGPDGPEYLAFAETGPIAVPLHRFFEGEGWVTSESGITNAAIRDGAATLDGRVLLVGHDLDACESAACIWEGGGSRATLWIGTPE